MDINFLTTKNIATGFQSYLTSFARSGDPNTYREQGGFPPTMDFPQTQIGSDTTVMNMDLLGFSIQDDSNTDAERCDFWQSGVWTGR